MKVKHCIIKNSHHDADVRNTSSVNKEQDEEKIGIDGENKEGKK